MNHIYMQLKINWAQKFTTTCIHLSLAVLMKATAEYKLNWSNGNVCKVQQDSIHLLPSASLLKWNATTETDRK